MNRRVKRLASISVAALALVVSFNLAMRAIESDVNNMSESRNKTQLISSRTVSDKGSNDQSECIPSGHPDAINVGAEHGENGLYEIWVYQETNGRFYREVSLDFEGLCGIAYSEQFDEAITNRIPLDIARSLTVQFYRSVAEDSGGVEAYREQMLTSLSTVNVDDEGFVNPGEDPPRSQPNVKPEINSVDLWALKQIGIDIPLEQITVVDIDNAWKYN